MTACTSCLHYNVCMERRGACSEYVTLETIRRQIIELNDANQKTASARPEADTALARQDRDGNRTPSRSENGETARCAGSKEEAPDTISGYCGISTEAV